MNFLYNIILSVIFIMLVGFTIYVINLGERRDIYSPKPKTSVAAPKPKTSVAASSSYGAPISKKPISAAAYATIIVVVAFLVGVLVAFKNGFFNGRGGAGGYRRRGAAGDRRTELSTFR